MTSVSTNKRALLIGINKYPNLPDFSQLRGCVNDVEVMKQTLETAFHFPSENIAMLCDEEAGVHQIRAAMEELVAACQPGDIVVFHYSGHGSRMAALGDKASGWDESIMPSDSGRMNPTFPHQVTPCDIRDTEIQEWLSRLTQKTSNVTLIFDSCHSGSITRMQDDMEEGTRLRWIEPDIAPGKPASHAARSAYNEETRDASGPSGWAPLSESYVLLAACAAEQGAYELDAPGEESSRRHGAFTYFLSQELNHAADNTYQDVWDMVATKVNNRFQKQTPQLEGARNRRVFDVDDFAPMRYLLVKERRGNELVLSGGLVHGVSLGSRWAVYAPATRETASEHQMGEIEIRAVTSTEATGLITSESEPNTIAAGVRAVEIVHVDPEASLTVHIASASESFEGPVSALKQELEVSPLLTLTTSAARARVTIQVEFENSEPVWVVMDQSQAQLMPRSSVTDRSAASRIRENLETIWRYQKVLELRNDKSSLNGKVEFELLKKDGSGQWTTVPDDTVFEDGESVAFRVMNQTGSEIYISVLDLGISKRISLLHPVAGASETVAGTRSGETAGDIKTSGVLTVGERPEDEIELFFPENLTFLRENGNGHLSGREIFKLCVTTERHDLRFLNQAGVRIETSSSFQGLEQMICLATGGSTREARSKFQPTDDWITLERSFLLRKKI
jgi:hypothetical protein